MEKKKIFILIVCLASIIISTVWAALLLKTDTVDFGSTACVVFERNAVNLYTGLSIVLGIIDSGIIYFTEKEASKLRVVYVGGLLFTSIYVYQCFSDIFSDNRKEVGTVAIVCIVILIYIIYIIQKNKFANVQNGLSDSSEKMQSEQALVRYVKRKIKKCHEAITSIQLHKVVEKQYEGQIIYDIEYIDSGYKHGSNLNTILSTELIVSKENYDLFQPFLDAYEKYLAAESDSQQQSCRETMVVLANNNIQKLKNELNSNIETISDIEIKECCASRMVLTYLSCLARIDEENADDYVGVRCESINVCSDSQEKEDINKQLFSKFHTGLLGALLLKTRPYVFYYEHENNAVKINRRYISFLLSRENASYSYLVLITVNWNENKKYFHISLLNAIRNIRKECIELYEKNEVKKNDAV